MSRPIIIIISNYSRFAQSKCVHEMINVSLFCESIQWISYKVMERHISSIHEKIRRCVFFPFFIFYNNLKRPNKRIIRHTILRIRSRLVVSPGSTISHLSLTSSSSSPLWLPRLVGLVDELRHQGQRECGAGLSWVLPSRGDGFVLPIVLLHHHLFEHSGRHLALHLVAAKRGRPVFRDKELKTSCCKT